MNFCYFLHTNVASYTEIHAYKFRERSTDISSGPLATVGLGPTHEDARDEPGTGSMGFLGILKWFVLYETHSRKEWHPEARERTLFEFALVGTKRISPCRVNVPTERKVTQGSGPEVQRRTALLEADFATIQLDPIVRFDGDCW